MSIVIFHTDGTGYWSRVAKPVHIVDMHLEVFEWPGDKPWGELMVYFGSRSWNVKEDGLIYTDKQFQTELNRFLTHHGLPAADYSEQGMQGRDYVSFDVDCSFVEAWNKKFSK